jgi:hypothetical protein
VSGYKELRIPCEEMNITEAVEFLKEDAIWSGMVEDRDKGRKAVGTAAIEMAREGRWEEVMRLLRVVEVDTGAEGKLFRIACEVGDPSASSSLKAIVTSHRGMSEVEKMYHAWTGCKGGKEWQDVLGEVEEVRIRPVVE